MTLSLVYDLMTLLTAGLIAAMICRQLNVSVLVGYLLVGALIGDGSLGWVHDTEHSLAHLAEVGVFLLLFSIGLEFSIDDLQRLGSSFVIAGGTQMVMVAAPVAALLHFTGTAWQPSLLIASAVAFSSTVLVFRALSEYGHAQRPHGRRAIGILLFQDATLIPLLLLVPLLTGAESAGGPTAFLKLSVISLAFIAAVIGLRQLLAQWVIPMFARFRSSELVVLLTTVSLGGVTLAAYSVGLPAAVGAFAAGLIFNGNRWSHQIDALILPFREVFAAIFFVGLGLIFDPRLLWQEPQLMLAALPAVIVLKGLAAATALRITGLPTRSAIGMGLGLAHVGEFSFVLVLLGVKSGVLPDTDYQRVVGIAVGSLVLTPTLLKMGLRLVQSDTQEVERSGRSQHLCPLQPRGVVIGAGPVGHRISSQLQAAGHDVCLADLSPINLHAFAQQGFRTVTGDATNDAVLRRTGLVDADWVVICVPDDDTATRVVHAAQRLNPDCRVTVRCRYQSNANKLKQAGAVDVVAEDSEAATAMMRLLTQAEQEQLAEQMS